VRYLGASITGHHAVLPDEAAAELHAVQVREPRWLFYLALLLLGTWLLLLMHRPRFRTWCADLLRGCWQVMRRLLVELPERFLRSPLVQQVLASQTYRALRGYVLRPAGATLAISLPSLIGRQPWSPQFAFDVFLVTALFLNSPIGRYADEWLTDVLVRAWHELRIRVFAAAYQWVMDQFHSLLVALERVLYSVDEWLRFRAGDKRLAEGVKLVTGTLWFFVSYMTV
jgi:hypothetical protein